MRKWYHLGGPAFNPIYIFTIVHKRRTSNDEEECTSLIEKKKGKN